MSGAPRRRAALVAVAAAWLALGCGDGAPTRGATPPPAARAKSYTPPPLPDAATTRFGRCDGTPGDKPIMAPCDDHCQCSTGYCYDEGFMAGGLRFCTMDCNAPTLGPCSTLTHPERPHQQGYGCLMLDGVARARGLETTRLCVVRCADVDECRQYSDVYDRCGNASGGKATTWDGQMLAAFPTCVVSTAVAP